MYNKGATTILVRHVEQQWKILVYIISTKQGNVWPNIGYQINSYNKVCYKYGETTEFQNYKSMYIYGQPYDVENSHKNL